MEKRVRVPLATGRGRPGPCRRRRPPPRAPTAGSGPWGLRAAADDDDEQRHRDRGHGRREQHDPLGRAEPHRRLLHGVSAARRRGHRCAPGSGRTTFRRTAGVAVVTAPSTDTSSAGEPVLEKSRRPVPQELGASLSGGSPLVADHCSAPPRSYGFPVGGKASARSGQELNGASTCKGPRSPLGLGGGCARRLSACWRRTPTRAAVTAVPRVQSFAVRTEPAGSAGAPTAGSQAVGAPVSPRRGRRMTNGVTAETAWASLGSGAEAPFVIAVVRSRPGDPGPRDAGPGHAGPGHAGPRDAGPGGRRTRSRRTR